MFYNLTNMFYNLTNLFYDLIKYIWPPSNLTQEVKVWLPLWLSLSNSDRSFSLRHQSSLITVFLRCFKKKLLNLLSKCGPAWKLNNTQIPWLICQIFWWPLLVWSKFYKRWVQEAWHFIEGIWTTFNSNKSPKKGAGAFQGPRQTMMR